MNAKRKQAETKILKYIDKLAAGGDNLKIYQEFFKRLSDVEFDNFMKKIRDKKTNLSVIVPHGGSVKVSVENNFKVAKELGYEFFQRLWVTDSETGDRYLTPNKFLIYNLPIRRTSQLLIKGIAIPKHSRSIDAMSGQVTGDSKATTMTMPEVQMLVGMGLEKTVLEILKYRGGDLGAKAALNNILYTQGSVDMATLDNHTTGVESTKTLKNYFLGMHIKPTGLDTK